MIFATLRAPIGYAPSDVAAAKALAEKALSDNHVDSEVTYTGRDPELRAAQLIVAELGIKATGVDTFQEVVAVACEQRVA